MKGKLKKKGGALKYLNCKNDITMISFPCSCLVPALVELSTGDMLNI